MVHVAAPAPPEPDALQLVSLTQVTLLLAPQLVPVRALLSESSWQKKYDGTIVWIETEHQRRNHAVILQSIGCSKSLQPNCCASSSWTTQFGVAHLVSAALVSYVQPTTIAAATVLHNAS